MLTYQPKKRQRQKEHGFRKRIHSGNDPFQQSARFHDIDLYAFDHRRGKGSGQLRFHPGR